MNDKEDIREFIREKYSDIALKGANGSGCSCNSSCCGDTSFDVEQKGWAVWKM